MVNETELFESGAQCSCLLLGFCLWGWMKKLVTRDELLARILDAAVRITKREDQLRLTTLDLRTRVANCIQVDGGIFEHLL